MTTVTLWLLVSLGFDAYRNSSSTIVVERFAAVEECQRVNKVLSAATNSSPLRCVQATVVIGAGVKP